MLRNSRKDYPERMTPRATVLWGRSLTEPDYTYKEGGEFSVKVAFDGDEPELADLIEYAEELRDAAFDDKVEELKRQKKMALIKKMEKLPVIREEEDQETGEKSGRLILRAGRVFRITPKKGPNAGKTFEFKPDFFDARGKRLKNPPEIGFGSVVKLAIRPVDYETKDTKTGASLFGTSYELLAVQIIKLVQGGSRTADQYGFAAEEDGDMIEDQEDSPFNDEGDGYEGDEDGENADF